MMGRAKKAGELGPYTESGEVRAERIEANPLRLIGWAFFICSLIAFANILFPTKLTQIEWEFATMGRIADNALLPLLGIALILYRRPIRLSSARLFRFRFATACALFFGLAFLAILPLAARNSIKLANTAEVRISVARQIHEQQAKDFEALIAKATTLQELQILGMAIKMTPDMAGRKANLPNETFEDFRNWLGSSASALQRRSLIEAETKFHNDHRAILKEGVKTCLVSCVAGLFGIAIFLQQRTIFRAHVKYRDGVPE